ncbi:cutinase 1 [Colletotrichum incanum]|uniref:cutinase n=1 Tax=Colletotrichum incanum TaxID=1573173 RepID=A0A166WG87_COLIC|nr:cutinase 1 [Colletotrichum incanum]OHW98467.1 cutinase [Colletotrichum incanum]
MKSFATLCLAAVAVSSPLMLVEHTEIETATRLESRQTGAIAKEFTQGGCRDVIFIFARGSTEVGNMVRLPPRTWRLGLGIKTRIRNGGSIVGPPTSNGLKKRYSDSKVATEGVDYAAALTTNFLPGGADPVGIDEMKRLLTDATGKCTNSKIVAGGYSQGAAVAHRAIESLPDAAKSKILGVVSYGDTQNRQDNGQILNFPKDRVKIICNDGDKVCDGTLEIQPAHLDYERRVPEAVEFLTGKIGNI